MISIIEMKAYKNKTKRNLFTKIYNFYEPNAEVLNFESLLCSCKSSETKTRRKESAVKRARRTNSYIFLVEIPRRYSHSGDNGRKDPPVPIPNTEVKLSHAESTCT